MRFFTPLPNFIPWLKREYERNKRPIIDCGCGDGDLVREMRAANLPALGIDPRYDIFNERVPMDLASAIVTMEAHQFSMVQSTPSILLVCRPCHSGFPAQIHQDKCSRSELYYIGFEKNIEFDLAGANVNLILMDPVGEEDEYLWRVVD